MKPVPMPKQEVIVRKDGGRFIRITTHTADAEAWLVKNAPGFGLLFGADYLASYNDPE